MRNKQGIVIHYGCGVWTVDIYGEEHLHFDVNRMTRAQQKDLRFQMTRAFRLEGERRKKAA